MGFLSKSVHTELCIIKLHLKVCLWISRGDVCFHCQGIHFIVQTWKSGPNVLHASIHLQSSMAKLSLQMQAICQTTIFATLFHQWFNYLPAGRTWRSSKCVIIILASRENRICWDWFFLKKRIHWSNIKIELLREEVAWKGGGSHPSCYCKISMPKYQSWQPGHINAEISPHLCQMSQGCNPERWPQLSWFHGCTGAPGNPFALGFMEFISVQCSFNFAQWRILEPYKIISSKGKTQWEQW